MEYIDPSQGHLNGGSVPLFATKVNVLLSVEPKPIKHQNNVWHEDISFQIIQIVKHKERKIFCRRLNHVKRVTIKV